MMRLNLNEIGCDLYTSSPHKWLQAPKGSGYLYLRDDAIMNKMWNTIATHGWDEPQLKAERFQHIGSSNVPIIAGLVAAIEFANSIGMERIERRHRQLADLQCVLNEHVGSGIIRQAVNVSRFECRDGQAVTKQDAISR